MQITETKYDGLVRELKVVVGADELEKRFSARLDELKSRVKLKGFRPGHVPKAHLRRVYGRSVMAEVVQQTVAETSQEAISQRQERPAFQPRIALPEDETEVGKILAGSGDLAYTMYFEVLPKFDLSDFSKIRSRSRSRRSRRQTSTSRSSACAMPIPALSRRMVLLPRATG